MRSVTFTGSASAPVSWTADEDLVLTGGNASSGAGAVVSCDPSLTYAGLATSPAMVERFILLITTAMNRPVNFPVSAGKQIFVAFSGAAPFTVVLYFDQANKM